MIIITYIIRYYFNNWILSSGILIIFVRTDINAFSFKPVDGIKSYPKGAY